MSNWPVNFPTIRQPIRMTPSRESVVGVFYAARTFKRQVQEFEGQRWKWSITLPNKMSQAEASEFQAFLLQMNGQAGTCIFKPVDRKSPRGSETGPIVVDGNGQLPRQNQLNVRGLTPDVVGALKKMDFIQLGTDSGSRLHALALDADSDSGGLATLTLWPNLREAPSDGDPVVINNPGGIFALPENDSSLGDVRAPLVYDGMVINLVEVI